MQDLESGGRGPADRQVTPIDHNGRCESGSNPLSPTHSIKSSGDEHVTAGRVIIRLAKIQQVIIQGR